MSINKKVIIFLKNKNGRSAQKNSQNDKKNRIDINEN